MPEAFKLEWDKTGERYYETGIDRGVLYPFNNDTKAYDKGVVWNGLTGFTEAPEGAEPNDLWADNIKYASLRSAEKLNGTIEAYMYPDEFMECDGSAELAPGVYAGQQSRKTFGACYRTVYGNDVSPDGYKLHLIYGATCSPSEKAYETVNDSPDAITMSWDFDTTPVNVKNLPKPTASLTIDSTKLTSTKLNALEKVLYGTSSAEARLPLPDEVLTIIGAVE